MKYLVLLLLLILEPGCIHFCDTDVRSENSCEARPYKDPVGGNNIPGVQPKKTLRKH